MRDKETASENLHFSADSNYFQIWAYPCPFCGFSKPENAPNNSDPTKLRDQACMACHLIQSFFREDDFTFYSSSEFTEQNPESRGESQVGFRKEPTDQTSGQSLRRALGAKQQIKQESFRFAITVSRVILKTWTSTILVPSAASLYFQREDYLQRCPGQWLTLWIVCKGCPKPCDKPVTYKIYRSVQLSQPLTSPAPPRCHKSPPPSAAWTSPCLGSSSRPGAYSPETGEIRGLGQMCPLVPVWL